MLRLDLLICILSLTPDCTRGSLGPDILWVRGAAPPLLPVPFSCIDSLLVVSLCCVCFIVCDSHTSPVTQALVPLHRGESGGSEELNNVLKFMQ